MQGQQVAHVGAGVAQRRGRHRPHSAIMALEALLQPDVEQIGQQVGQAVTPDAEQTGGDHRVEYGRDAPAEVTAEGQDIALRRVEDLGVARVIEQLGERRQFLQRLGVDDPLVGAVSQLDQADTRPIGVEGVGFGVHRDQRCLAQVGQHLRQLHRRFHEPRQPFHPPPPLERSGRSGAGATATGV